MGCSLLAGTNMMADRTTVCLVFKEFKVSITICSCSESRALVGSSSTRIGALVRSARARAILWRCPPERFIPESSNAVWYWSGNASIKLSAPARRAASRMCSCVAAGQP
jgi:hypothetical protein